VSRQPTRAAGGGRPLLLTAHPGLLDDLLRLCAAAGVEAQTVSDPGAARSAWLRAPLVVVGADVAERTARRGLGRREGVVLVGLDQESPHVWEQAVAVGAAEVAILPAQEAWLAERLADAAEGSPGAALVVATLGGRGGAGATTLAAALAVTGQRAGQRTTLVDGDPLGGGIDLVLGGEDTGGPRWPDLAGTRGRVGAGVLHEVLPRVGGLTVLSWDRGERRSVPREAMAAVLSAAGRGGDLVVVDLPRHLDPAAEEALGRCDVALLVVPAEVRATAAAARVAASAALVAGDLRVVVRGPAPAGLAATVVADALGLPLAGSLRPEPGLAEALERGEPPARRGRGPLAEFCRGFLAVGGSRRAAA
jgi:secretion/DNA translocation related CpaE-like protein